MEAYYIEHTGHVNKTYKTYPEQIWVQIHCMVFKHKYKYYNFSKYKYNYKYFDQDSI